MTGSRCLCTNDRISLSFSTDGQKVEITDDGSHYYCAAVLVGRIMSLVRLSQCVCHVRVLNSWTKMRRKNQHWCKCSPGWKYPVCHFSVQKLGGRKLHKMTHISSQGTRIRKISNPCLLWTRLARWQCRNALLTEIQKKNMFTGGRKAAKRVGTRPTYF